MRAYDFGAAPLSERERSERLDQLNALFGAHTTVLDLVQNATLRRQMESNRAAIAHFSALRYPVLLLFGVLDLYMKLTRDAAPLLRLRLGEADTALQKLLAAGGARVCSGCRARSSRRDTRPRVDFRPTLSPLCARSPTNGACCAPVAIAAATRCAAR